MPQSTKTITRAAWCRDEIGHEAALRYCQAIQPEQRPATRQHDAAGSPPVLSRICPAPTRHHARQGPTRNREWPLQRAGRDPGRLAPAICERPSRRHRVRAAPTRSIRSIRAHNSRRLPGTLQRDCGPANNQGRARRDPSTASHRSRDRSVRPAQAARRTALCWRLPVPRRSQPPAPPGPAPIGDIVLIADVARSTRRPCWVSTFIPSATSVRQACRRAIDGDEAFKAHAHRAERPARRFAQWRGAELDVPAARSAAATVSRRASTPRPSTVSITRAESGSTVRRNIRRRAAEESAAH